MQSILIIDDDANIQQVFKRLLERNYFTVYQATNVREALVYMNMHRIDCVLLDIKMPGGCGDEFFHTIRHAHPKTCVIVSSVYPIEDQKRVIPGADDYFDKSDGIKVLLHKVQYSALMRKNTEQG